MYKRDAFHLADALLSHPDPREEKQEAARAGGPRPAGGRGCWKADPQEGPG